MTASPHVFDVAVALAPHGEHVFQGHTSPAYANMIGPYGGITAAQALNAVMQHPARIGEPVSLTVNYAAALTDGPFFVHARPARTNRSTQHWMVEVRQGDEVMVTATVFTALRRETWSANETVRPDVPRPAYVPPPQGRGRVEWINRYDLRFIEGEIPAIWEGGDEGHSRTRLWVRDKPERPLDFVSLAAVSDVFFPRIWRRRATFVPIGTVTMTVYFHADAAMLAATGTQYLLAQAQGHAFHKGYFDHSGQLWNEAGQLLATTHQVVYYKE
jgi:acyl-CoA thioesterase